MARNPNALLAAQFPVMDTMVYANHAAIAPWPRATAEAVTAFAEENLVRASLGYRDWLDRETRLRQLAAELMNAGSGDDIALLKNTSEGINLVANGVDWRAGDNLVLPTGEFASNDMPWAALERLGVAARHVDIRAAVDPEQALIEAVDERTRLLTVSSVQWSDGFRLRLDVLGEACRSAGVVFFVDAIQEFGALPMDVTACRIDCLAAGAHKWQLGPEGIGVFYCSPQMRESLRLSQFGWHQLDHPYWFDRPDRQPSSSARRFEAGSPNSVCQAGLLASLSLLAEIGMHEVSARVTANSARLMDALPSLPGVRLVSRGEPERRSGIVSFRVDGRASGKVVADLRRHDVVAANRGGAVRLSPHFYQAGAQLERLLEAVEQVVTT